MGGEAQAMTATATVQRRASCAKAVSRMRRVSMSAATFVAADMNAVTEVGAPS